jgi:hypothetical protein
MALPDDPLIINNAVFAIFKPTFSKKKPGCLFIPGNPAISNPRETRGFPSPPRGGFGLYSG